MTTYTLLKAAALEGDFVRTSGTALTYASPVALVFDNKVKYDTLSITGDLIFTASGYAARRMMVLRISADGTDRALVFPSGWEFAGTKPDTIEAGTKAVLSLTCFGGSASDVVAAWVVTSA